jgi:hypothetical protein
VIVDRADLTGATTGAVLALATGLVLTGLWWLMSRGTPQASTASGYVAAVLTATLTANQTWIVVAPGSAATAATAVQAALTMLAYALFVALIATSTRGAQSAGVLASAVAVVELAGSYLPGCGWLVPVAALLNLAVLALLAGAAWAGHDPAPRLGVPGLGVPGLGVRCLGVRRPDVRWLGALASITVGWAAPLLLFLLAWWDWSRVLGRYNEWVVGDYLTALAGNRPPYDPQGYTFSIYLAFAVGLTFAGAVAAGALIRGRPERAPGVAPHAPV